MKKVNDKFLKVSECIDFNTQNIINKCEELKEENQSKEAYAKLAFEFVRDEIKHSIDHNIDILTVKASEVLEHKTGLCFAKSHLLAALLRVNNIPCGLSYQRLQNTENNEKFNLHGLNAIYLKKHGWFKIDPRGNNENLSVDFNPPGNSFAYKADNDGEYTDDYMYDKPHQYLIEELLNSKNIAEFLENIPDDY